MCVIKRCCQLLLLPVLIAVLTGCQGHTADVQSIEKTVQGYYSLQYKSYAELTYHDLSGCLDLSSKPCESLETYSRAITERRRYIAAKKYYDVSTEKTGYTLRFQKIRFSGNGSASLAVDVHVADSSDAPWFILPHQNGRSDENIFYLKKTGGRWLITDYNFADARLMSLKAGTIAFDIDAIHRQVDVDFGYADKK